MLLLYFLLFLLGVYAYRGAAFRAIEDGALECALCILSLRFCHIDRVVMEDLGDVRLRYQVARVESTVVDGWLCSR